jgi:uncharacterized membrane protein YfcA
MDAGSIVLLLILGVAAGFTSGMFGIGGGIVIIPALVYIMKFNQHMAQGTALAILVPPIGIVAAYNYYQKGYVDINTAGIMILGFVVGAYFGSKTALSVSDVHLNKVFAVVLILVGLKVLLSK